MISIIKNELIIIRIKIENFICSLAPYLKNSLAPRKCSLTVAAVTFLGKGKCNFLGPISSRENVKKCKIVEKMQRKMCNEKQNDFAADSEKNCQSRKQQ